MPVLPQKVEKKPHPNSFYILSLDRKRKYNTENIDYFYSKFDDFYPLKSFLSAGNL